MANSPKQPLPPPELPWSLHKSSGWRSQLERVRRWQRRVVVARGSPEVEDYLYAFFQNCYHLRDWLQVEQAVPQTALEEFFRVNVEMRLCQDVCNATKHLKLSDPKLGREFSMAREYIGPSPVPNAPTTTLVLLAGSSKYDAFDLMGKCLGRWEAFLRGQDHAI